MKDKQINIRVDKETYQILKELAPEHNVSFFVRLLIKKEIDKFKNKD